MSKLLNMSLLHPSGGRCDTTSGIDGLASEVIESALDTCMNSPQPPRLIRFAVFELDLRARELRRAGKNTGLPDQSITVLAMLLEQPGDLVLREDIRTKLWPND